MEGLGLLSDSVSVDERCQDFLENFVCLVHSQSKTMCVNQARKDSKYKPKENNVPLEKITGMDASMIPPCQKTLHLKLHSANFVTRMWKRSDEKDLLLREDPCNHGWREEAGVYSPVWFWGEQVPRDLCENTEDMGEENPEDTSAQLDSEDDESDQDDLYNSKILLLFYVFIIFIMDAHADA